MVGEDELSIAPWTSWNANRMGVTHATGGSAPATHALHRAQRLLSRRRGQALIEFSLIAIVMVMMLVGVVDVGRMFYASIIIHEAAQNGALVAQVTSNYTGACSASATCANDRVKDAIERTAPSWIPINRNTEIDLNPSSGAWTDGQPFRITVRHTFTFVTPYFGSLTAPMSATVTGCRAGGTGSCAAL
jgi:Flp pilus assembly protein TadG